MGALNTLLTVFIGLVFSLWILATIVNSFRSGKDILAETLGLTKMLVPSWNFFSPHPGQHDYYLLYRDRRVDGTMTPWKRVEMFRNEPNRLVLFWNPYRFKNKALFDLVDFFRQQMKERAEIQEKISSAEDGESDELRSVDLDTIQTSVLYMALLHIVNAQEHTAFSEAVQFMIMQHSVLHDERKPTFVSDVHSLSHD